MTSVREHDCRREFTITVDPDPMGAGPRHRLQACETCLYAKSALAAYMVAEERNPRATITLGEEE